MRKFLSLVLISSIIYIYAYSQTPIRGKTDNSFLSDFVHRVYTPADGLPGMTITNVSETIVDIFEVTGFKDILNIK